MSRTQKHYLMWYVDDVIWTMEVYYLLSELSRKETSC